MANYLGNDLLMTHINQYLDGTAPGGVAELGAFLQRHNLTPADVAATLQAKGVGDASTVSQFVAQNPELAGWAGGGQTAAQPAAATAQPFGGTTAGATAQGPSPNPYLPGAGPGGLTLAPNPEGGYNTYQAPAAATPATQQMGVPGASQPNPYLPATGSSTQPMAGGGFNSYNGQSMQGTQGQRPQGQNPYLQGGGRQQGFAPPWDNANPNTQWMAGQISQGVTDHLQRNLLPGIRSSASMAGGLGGSRQGIAEGIAIGDSAKGLSSSLAGLYGGQYNQDRQYGLQNDALDLNVYNANQNWMRQGQQDQLGLVDRMLGWNASGLGTAQQARDQPFNDWNRFVNPATQIGGMGGTNSQQMQGNPYLGALGGAMTGYNLYNSWNKGQ